MSSGFGRSLVLPILRDLAPLNPDVNPHENDESDGFIGIASRPGLQRPTHALAVVGTHNAVAVFVGE